MKLFRSGLKGSREALSKPCFYYSVKILEPRETIIPCAPADRFSPLIEKLLWCFGVRTLHSSE